MQIKRLLAIATFGLVLGACTAEVEEEGSLPDVDVSGGQAPSVDVDPANVNVGTDTQTVVTPDVSVTPTEGNDKDK
jgi:hypothetical protein